MEDECEESLEFMIAMDEVDDQHYSDEAGRKRNELLKCIKGKTLSEAKELVFVIKHEMCPFRKLH